ncbi:unnamed protein product [Lupinus luteus]|uniref:DUF7054 domain-containing protein n=1 Tax=Lupinus luteus TaxID=3873 RepID=A0AAV1VX47_LUPLU
MKKSSLEKMGLQKRRNKGMLDHRRTRENNKIKFLINVNVQGSTGPLRFLVNEREKVCRVIGCALKHYAGEERLPVLGSDASNFLLYCVNSESDALNPLEPIGSFGGRNFVLCKKKLFSPTTEPQSKQKSSKSNGRLKKLLNKIFSIKIFSH